MAETPTCVILKRWHPGISTLVANVTPAMHIHISPEWKTMTDDDELVHFLPMSYHISGAGSDVNVKMPIQMALTTNLVKIESAKQLDQHFPHINITVITEPIQDQRNCQAELEEKRGIYIQSKQDDIRLACNWANFRNWNDQ